jgi:translocation protein SEC63
LSLTEWLLHLQGSKKKPWLSGASRQLTKTGNLVLIGLWVFFFFLVFYVQVSTMCIFTRASLAMFVGPAAELSHWDAQVAIKDSAPFDPYNILELEKGATDKEVKRAYRQLSLKFHPDKNPDPEANKYFAEYITKAYQALSDPVARDNYEKYGHPDGQQVMHHDVSLCACAGTRLHMRMHLQGILRCIHAG